MAPDKPNQLPRTFTWHGTEFGGIQQSWLPSSASALPTVVQRDARLMESSRIDPKIVIHPPNSSLGVQPQGTMVAQNLYPGLRFLPVEISSAKLEPIPLLWPNLKIQPIPIEWKNAKLLPVTATVPTANPGASK